MSIDVQEVASMHPCPLREGESIYYQHKNSGYEDMWSITVGNVTTVSSVMALTPSPPLAS